MKLRNVVVGLLLVTVVAPIVLYTDTVATFKSPSSRSDFLEDAAALTFGRDHARLNLLPQESSASLKEPIGIVYSDESSGSSVDSFSSRVVHASDLFQDIQLLETRDHKSSRVLSATSEYNPMEKQNPIKQVTDVSIQRNIPDGGRHMYPQKDEDDVRGNWLVRKSDDDSQNMLKEVEVEHLASQASGESENRDARNVKAQEKNEQAVMPDARVRHLKDQLIRARVYLSLPSTKTNSHFVRELRSRIKEVQRTLGDVSKDADLPSSANEKLRAMEQTLVKGKQIHDDCAAVVKKLRAMLHSTEEQLRVNKKQTMFLTQLTAKTLPKGLHCLPLRLTAEYYSLNSSQQQFPNEYKLEDPQQYHYALFSDNILAAAVVVNSTVTNSKHPSRQVFHIVTDRLNYAAMRMWFLVNPPGPATIQVQNIEELTWLNSSYSPVLRQLGSPTMIDYYFRAHRASSDSNLKFRNPKYLSILNHLRFYLPEIFPKLNKVVFLDDDIVVQKDLSPLWLLDLKGNVNGAVETCGESFHRFDRYLNFSNPLISKNFDPRACGWAYGMNVFDLDEWRRQNITDIYHRWQSLNHDRQLWKLGTLPPGLITFWKRTYSLDRNWHILGLGYNPNVNQRDIERAAVIHYNGNLKPWLEIAIPKYRALWSKYVDYDHMYLRECNINP